MLFGRCIYNNTTSCIIIDITISKYNFIFAGPGASWFFNAISFDAVSLSNIFLVQPLLEQHTFGSDPPLHIMGYNNFGSCIRIFRL